jgi:hypothetical protein
MTTHLVAQFTSCEIIYKTTVNERREEVGKKVTVYLKELSCCLPREREGKKRKSQQGQQVPAGIQTNYLRNAQWKLHML